MKTVGKLFGIIGVIMFIFGIIAFVLTQANSLFFYFHIFGGLTLLLLYFIMIFKGSREFLGLMLLVIITIVGVIISATANDSIYMFAIPAGIMLFLFIGFNLDVLTKPKKLIYLLIPVLLFSTAFIFRQKLNISKYFIFLVFFGVLLNLSSFILNIKIIRGGVFGKSTKYAVNVIVYSFIFLLIIIVLNVLGYQVNLKKDFTENKINTLSDQSLKILKGLDKDVEIFAFLAEKHSAKNMLKDVLELYSSASKKVKVEFIDPDAKPQSAKQHNAKDGDIVIASGGEENLIKEMTEEAITSAIIKVMRTSKPTLCFTQGHGEMKLDDQEQDGLGAVAGGIKNEGYETENLDTITEGIPNKCDILVVAGPKIPYTKRESAVIGEYLDKGGKGLFMLDPRIPDTRLAVKISVLDTGLEDLASSMGVKLGRDFVLERHLQLFAGMTLESSVQANKYGAHPIVAPLEGKITMFPKSVRSVTKLKKEGKGGTVTEFVSSAAGKGLSWAETDIDSVIKRGSAKVHEGDIEGPVPIAVSVERDLIKTTKDKTHEEPVDERTKKREKMKSIWIGNSSFVSNGFVRTVEFNWDLYLNMLSWLWGDEEKISIRPKTLKTSVLLLTPEQSNMIFYISVLTIPEIILVFGLVIWFKRRKK